MMNWAVGREYLEKTSFRRGTETLIQKLREDNQRRWRLLPDEELRLLAAAPPHLRSMINLRWHDLRHEYASRLVERGVPPARVRDLLGHASITTTERYDNQKPENLQIAAAKLESGLTFEPSPRTLVRRSPATDPAGEGAKFQESFKIAGQQEGSALSDAVPATEPNELSDLNLDDWLGGRDSVLLARRECASRHDRKACRAANERA